MNTVIFVAAIVFLIFIALCMLIVFLPIGLYLFVNIYFITKDLINAFRKNGIEGVKRDIDSRVS